jgi:copper homeostasis protein
MSLTCHRAFDMVRDPAASLETLIGLGVDRILTSGGEPSVPEALDSLQALAEQAGDRISIMPGGGVRKENIREIVEKTGIREIHFTAFSNWESPMGFRNPRPHMGSASVPGEYERVGTDPEEVRRIMGALAEGD